MADINALITFPSKLSKTEKAQIYPAKTCPLQNHICINAKYRVCPRIEIHVQKLSSGQETLYV